MLVFCLLSGRGEAESIRTVVTIAPIAFITKSVGGDDVDIHILLKSGADPHLYEPTPAEGKMVKQAGLIISAGFGFDEWIEKFINKSDSNHEIVDVSSAVKKPIMRGDGHEKHGHEKHNKDPHYWLDPIIMGDVAKLLYKELSKLKPSAEERFSARLESTLKMLNKLDKDTASKLRNYKGYKFMGYHSAWRYFARRYDLVEVDQIIKSHGVEPGARHFARIVRLVREGEVHTIFADKNSSKRMISAVTGEGRADVAVLDPIGSSADINDYKTLIEKNVAEMIRSF